MLRPAHAGALRGAKSALATARPFTGSRVRRRELSLVEELRQYAKVVDAQAAASGALAANAERADGRAARAEDQLAKLRDRVAESEGALAAAKRYAADKERDVLLACDRVAANAADRTDTQREVVELQSMLAESYAHFDALAKVARAPRADDGNVAGLAADLAAARRDRDALAARAAAVDASADAEAAAPAAAMAAAPAAAAAPRRRARRAARGGARRRGSPAARAGSARRRRGARGPRRAPRRAPRPRRRRGPAAAARTPRGRTYGRDEKTAARIARAAHQAAFHRLVWPCASRASTAAPASRSRSTMAAARSTTPREDLRRKATRFMPRILCYTERISTKLDSLEKHWSDGLNLPTTIQFRQNMFGISNSRVNHTSHHRLRDGHME